MSRKLMKKLGDAELEIMQAVWQRQQPMASGAILQAMKQQRDWGLSTLMTSLARLVDKGFLACDRSSGSNLYSAVVSEEQYKAQEGRSFLEKLYGNSFESMVTSFYGNQVIDEHDLSKLRQFLDELEGEN